MGKVTHGNSRRKTKTRTYTTWSGMVARCHIPSATGYDRYGAQGVQVCERWRTFENFLADMGPAPPGMMIDRENNELGYEPGNCRWVTRQVQNENRRYVKLYSHNGVSLSATAWARRLGITQATMQERLQKWPLLQALGVEPRPPQTNFRRGPVSEEHRAALRAGWAARKARLMADPREQPQ